MSEETTQQPQGSKKDASKGLGIAGLVVGILTLLVSFIPCFGMYAMYIGIVAILLSGIGLYIASKNNSSKGMLIAALIVSILGFAIAYNQYSQLKDLGDSLQDLNEELELQLEEMDLDTIE